MTQNMSEAERLRTYINMIKESMYISASTEMNKLRDIDYQIKNSLNDQVELMASRLDKLEKKLRNSSFALRGIQDEVELAAGTFLEHIKDLSKINPKLKRSLGEIERGVGEGLLKIADHAKASPQSQSSNWFIKLCKNLAERAFGLSADKRELIFESAKTAKRVAQMDRNEQKRPNDKKPKPH